MRNKRKLKKADISNELEYWILTLTRIDKVSILREIKKSDFSNEVGMLDINFNLCQYEERREK